MSQPIAAFERELTLQEYFRGIDLKRLLLALQTLLGTPITITDTQGIGLVDTGAVSSETPRIALIGELETIAYVTGNADPQLLQAAANLIMLLMRTNAKYIIGADLHLQTQLADFEELQRRHDALEISEQRYKALAETLERRVDEQVKTIEKAQIKIYENEKLASVGRLAAGIAHEINNPIGFIQSNLNTLLSYLDSIETVGKLIESGADSGLIQSSWQKEDMAFIRQDMKDILSECIQGTSRISAIVKDLKGFSRIDQADYEPAHINDILRQVCHLASAELENKAKVVMDLGEIPILKCHAGQLGQVFLGLLLNAVDAISENGKILIRTRLNGDDIEIIFKDNGCGIAESTLRHVFDPFFTTKEVGQGIGLGLTVCLDIIKSHGGTMEISSRQREGTLISIALPINTGPRT